MRIIALDVHRTFAQVAVLEDGKVRNAGKIDLEHSRLLQFAKRLKPDDEIIIEAGGLGRQIRIYRLPESSKVASMQITHDATGTEAIKGDVPVYIRVTQEDGNQAWSSPIYLIKGP